MLFLDFPLPSPLLRSRCSPGRLRHAAPLAACRARPPRAPVGRRFGAQRYVAMAWQRPMAGDLACLDVHPT